MVCSGSMSIHISKHIYTLVAITACFISESGQFRLTFKCAHTWSIQRPYRLFRVTLQLQDNLIHMCKWEIISVEKHSKPVLNIDSFQDNFIPCHL